ncbi:MAG: flagellar basal-body rod protein FlgF [bacterium]|nr:flagellar basal-body rod protein FlgF [bacterium]
MIKGLYSSASGMLPSVKRQEVLANNISNASTPGYKKDRLFTTELTRAEKKQLPTQSDWVNPMANDIFVDFEQANFDRTGNPLDMAIDGEGFFTLQLEDGQQVLTRSGSFTVDESGYLSFPGGALVMGEGGPIQVGDGKISVGQTGEIESDGLAVGRIVPVTVDDLQKLEKIGSSLYAVPEGVQLTSSRNFALQQGFVESANVDIVREMIDMIISFREFEANAKSIQAQDQSLDNLFRRVGGNG